MNKVGVVIDFVLNEFFCHELVVNKRNIRILYLKDKILKT